MAKYEVCIYLIVSGVTIVSTPAGTPVSGSTNTFDYPILSSVNLTCMVTLSNGEAFTGATTYQWNTTGCYTNTARNSGNPTCFPNGQTTQSVTDNNLRADDAGTITCTVSFDGVNYTSDPLTLRISGDIIICTVFYAHPMVCISYILLLHCPTSPTWVCMELYRGFYTAKCYSKRT